MNSLQYAYDKFRKEYTIGKGANREEVERAFKERMKQMQETPIKGPDSNSPYFKAGGEGDVNSLKNKFGGNRPTPGFGRTLSRVG